MTVLLTAVQRRLPELSKYASVGLVAFVVDVVAFNVLVFTSGSPLAGHSLLGKTLSVTLATTVAFIGNRHWTFSARTGSGLHREYVLFFVVSALGLGIALACLWTSQHVFGLHSRLADNIAGNGIGLVLGTVFRYICYRTFVFHTDAKA